MDLRRSKRVHAQLPVIVQGKATDETTFADPTRAIILSAHGCLITLSESVRLGEKLILRSGYRRFGRLIRDRDRMTGKQEGTEIASCSPTIRTCGNLVMALDF